MFTEPVAVQFENVKISAPKRGEHRTEGVVPKRCGGGRIRTFVDG
jgi:hypothetical protein